MKIGGDSVKKKLELIAKYVTNVLLFFVVVAILIASYSLIQLSVLHKGYVNYFGYTVFIVESGSMEPAIKTKDMVVVKLTDKYKVNDVITFEQDGSFVTHRILKANKNNLLTKGDANDSEDKLVARENVLGKVVKVLPKYGLWKEVLLSPIVLLVIFATIIIISFGCSYKTKAKRKQELKDYLASEDVDDVKEKEEIKGELIEEIKEELKDEIADEIKETPKSEGDLKESILSEIKEELKEEIKEEIKGNISDNKTEENVDDLIEEVKEKNKEVIEESNEEEVVEELDLEDNNNDVDLLEDDNNEKNVEVI